MHPYRKCQLLSRSITIGLVALAATLGSRAVSVAEFNPGCRLPFENIKHAREVDRACSALEGDASIQTQAAQNRAKNNFCASGRPIPVTLQTFADLQRAVERQAISFGSTRLPDDRVRLQNLLNVGAARLGEGSLVQLVAFVVRAVHSNVAQGESVNCHIPGRENNDLNFWLTESLSAELCGGILAEISPHYRPSAWDELPQVTLTQPVRVSGQLFFDASHVPCKDGRRSNPARASLWEIHPVYGIDVCGQSTLLSCIRDDATWMPLHEWLGAVTKPVKLTVLASEETVRRGQQVMVQIGLRDARDRPAKAPHDYTVTVDVLSSAGKVQSRSVTIKAGETEARLNITPTEDGIVELRAKHRELLDGGAALKVRTSAGSRQGDVPDFRGQLRILPAASAQQGGSQQSSEQRIPLVVVPTSEGKLRLTLRYNPRRLLLAGKEAATIEAWVLGNAAATEDITIRLSRTLGQFLPQELVIPKEQDKGEVRLISDKPGTAEVEFIRSDPEADVEGDRLLKITFGEPITALDLQPSPPHISLLETADLVVRLIDDEKKQSHPTERKRIISFSIGPGAGRGAIDRSDVTIPEAESSARTRLVPYWPGQVTVLASSDNLPTQSTQIMIQWPIMLLLLSSGGGLAGGWLAFLVRPGSRLWRIALGLITGFLLYWGFTFGVLTAIPRGVVLNPLSAVALSVIGGWLGTEVFAIVLRRLGITV